MDKISVIFLGSPEFAIPSLHALNQRDFSITAVFTQPDKPTGRKQILTPVPVKVEALKLGLKVEQPATKKELTKLVKKYQPDICIVVAYGMIIPDECLAIPKYGFINLHPSLLPLYRGPSPIQTALLNGDKKTGVSIIPLTKEVDAGPIIIQKIIEIEPNETAVLLSNRLAEVGAEVLAESITKLINNEVNPVTQDDNLATFSQKITREDGLIDWNKPFEQIFNQFRAFDPWPGVFTYFNDKRLKIVKLGLWGGDFEYKGEVGAVFEYQGEIGVVCGQGSVRIEQVQLEGKAVISAQDFLKSYGPQKLGS